MYQLIGTFDGVTVRFSCDEQKLSRRYGALGTGTFHAWESVEDMLRDPVILEEVTTDIARAYKEALSEFNADGKKNFQYSFNIDHTETIGRSRATGAPTDRFTLDFDLRFSPGKCRIEIVDMYPEDDVDWKKGRARNAPKTPVYEGACL